MRNSNRCIFIIIVVCFWTSCIADIERSISLPSNTSVDITVSQAREFFEQEFLTRDDANPARGVMSPGDFTPRWDDVQVSQNHRIACVDVPIIPKYSYKAIRSEYRLGKATAYAVTVSQKAIVVKDRSSGRMAQYIMSLIPDREFAATHKGDISNIFLNANDRGAFSGIVLYTYHGVPIRFSKYIDGTRVKGISTCGVSDHERYKELLQRIYQNLSKIKVLRHTGIASRLGEDAGLGFDGGEIEPIIVTETPSHTEGDNDGPPSQQPDPENPDKEPLENPDEEENIGNDGNEDNDNNSDNSNNSDNTSTTYSAAISDIVSHISNATLKKLMQDNTNVPFVKQDTVAVMNIKFTVITMGNHTKIEISHIAYNPQEVRDLSENGLKIVILHEFMHAYLSQIGQGGKQEEEHQKFVERGEYLQAIKELLPDEDDELYGIVKYAGCVDCEAFNGLSPEKKERITDMLDYYNL